MQGKPTRLSELQKKKPVPAKYLSNKAKKAIRENKVEIPVKKKVVKKRKKKIHVSQHRIFSKLQNMGYTNEHILSIVGSKNTRYMRKGAVLTYPKQLLTMAQIEQIWHLVKSDLTINEYLFDYLKFGEIGYKSDAEFDVRMAKLLYEPTLKVSKHLPKRVIPREVQKKVRKLYEDYKQMTPEEKEKQLWI